jgi:hypothetical protein
MNEYEKALAHAKAGRLTEAQQLLMGLDDERSNRLLEKVNKAIAARGGQQVTSDTVAQGIKQAEQEKAKNGLYGCLIFFAIAAICALWITVAAAPRPEENVRKMCQQVDELGFQCNEQQLLSTFRHVVDICQAKVGNWDDAWPYQWETCVQDNGISFPPKQ